MRVVAMVTRVAGSEEGKGGMAMAMVKRMASEQW
jgi:hypothetical protein